jgi:hypothetical protein
MKIHIVLITLLLSAATAIAKKQEPFFYGTWKPVSGIDCSNLINEPEPAHRACEQMKADIESARVSFSKGKMRGRIRGKNITSSYTIVSLTENSAVLKNKDGKQITITKQDAQICAAAESDQKAACFSRVAEP